MMAEKKKQNQPKHHAGKSRLASAIRRQKIIKAIAEGKTQKQAGIIAGLNPNNAESQVCNILKEPQVKVTFKDLLDKVVPDTVLAAKYNQLMESKKHISVMNDCVEVDDCPTQLKTADSISKLKGHLTERHDLNFNISNLTDEQLRELAEGKMPKDI